MMRARDHVLAVTFLLVLSVGYAHSFSEGKGSPDNELDQSPAIPISEGSDESPPNDRLVVHNGVSVEKHRWEEHTNSHDPCRTHQCPTGKVCRVVKNPVLQFPVPVCELDKTAHGGKPADSTEQCVDEHLGGNPFACSTEADFRAQADTKCHQGNSQAKVSSFKVVQPCLTFSATTEYLFTNFKCCRPADSPPKANDTNQMVGEMPATNQKPATPKTSPLPPKEHKVTPSLPASREQGTSKPVIKAIPQPTSLPVQKVKPDMKPTMAKRPEVPQKKPTMPQKANPAKQPPVKPTTKDLPTSQDKSPATPKQEPLPKAEEPTPQVKPSIEPAQSKKKNNYQSPKEEHEKETLHTLLKPSVPEVDKAEEEREAVKDSNLHPSVWGGVAIGAVVVLAIIVTLVIVTKLRSKNLFLYKPTPHTQLHEETDETEKMAFDDTELAFFVNQEASGDGLSQKEYIDEADPEPGHIEHWDMDALSFAQTHHNKAMVDIKQ